MGISLGGVQRGVTEQFLDRAQISPALKDMGCRRVTKSMRGQTRAPRVDGDSLDDGANGPLADSCAPAAHEKGGSISREPVSNPDPLANRNGGGNAEGHDPLLAALAKDSHRSRIKIEVA